MASTYLTKTSTAGNRQKFTTSFWFKLAKADSTRMSFFSATETTDGTNLSYMRVDDKISIREAINNTANILVETNRFFRDINAWYHVVFTVDTTQATSSDRVKIYVNGVQETSLASATYPSQNYNTRWNESGQVMQIGRNVSAYTYYFDGSISHFHHCDGYAYDASAFGSTDSTTGEWKININPNVSYGNNGFFILKDGNSVTDQSGNSNNFTVAGGTVTKTEDCPSNVFATLNSLDRNTNVVLQNGNNTSYSSANNTWSSAIKGTLGIASGKFYWEMKITGSGTANGLFFGVCADTVTLITNQGIQDDATERAKGVLVLCDDGQYQLDTNSRTSMTSTPAFNDILGCAVDRDNNTVKFYKNGSEVGSIDISSSPLATCSHIMPLMINYYTNTKFNFNFGNGYFGTTAVSSAGTNASGIGIFEYDVPTGFTALSTKGLNE